MESIASNLNRIREQIGTLSVKAGREPSDVRLIAVSKTKPARLVREAFDAGQIEFGESYVQEFLEKRDDPLLQGLPLQWHFIGHLQSNKIRSIAGKVALVHGIDRLSTAAELSRRSMQQNLHTEFLLEVNTSGEQTKYGISPDVLLSEAEKIFKLPNIALRGLMTIASPDTDLARKEFRELRNLLEALKKNAPDPTLLTELSMGMSQDFESAIEEGATIIRIGTAIFGWR
ncbi:YggS family pyridoxal phosphate-dependent enzyme [Chlorobium phaeobacteroides]|uniref:Pyridoxal phosphate homeostasis protein n=1 Tax=Chlorobium phaeobacteroides (strain DSM 266 / SMG 266 / 2430) TaxID=290317 RepID=A1BED1_CHLPD|nr:YggS family pyridoxal phosphate-dependent enzyme [Chlorobium phaeobacteroides]ABL64758.1 alanine racemase domain protein [Chlorobium phaeobacteroides DSM 266]